MATAPTSPRSMQTYISNRSLIFLLLTLVAMGLLALLLFARTNPDDTAGKNDTAVATANVRADGGGSYEMVGRVESALPLQAATAISGRVIRLSAQVGDPVREGQVLAVIDGDAQRLRIDQAQAEVARAATTAAERETAARRAEGLLAAGSMSQSETQAIRAEATSARHALTASNAALAIARKDASLTIVRAPGNGFVTARRTALGSVVSPGQVLFDLDQGTARTITLAVPQSDAPTLRPGSTLRYQAGGITGTAVVETLSPRVEEGGFQTARLSLRSGSPSPGSTVILTFDLPTTGGIWRIPASSIQLDAKGRRYVYVIDKQQRARPVFVTLLGLIGADARVRGAFDGTTHVVMAGGNLIRNGQPVRIVHPGL